MVYDRTTTTLDAETVLREGGAIAGLLFVWSAFAAASLFVADMAPRDSPVVPLARGGYWFFVTVGIANVAFYVILKSIAYWHAFESA